MTIGGTYLFPSATTAVIYLLLGHKFSIIYADCNSTSCRTALRAKITDEEFPIGVSDASPKGGNLKFERLEPHVPCYDGTPAGIYVDTSARDDGSAGIMPQDHVIFLQGGGACRDDEDCIEKQEREPVKFSSSFFPTSITGNTILSDDANENPTLHDATKWLIPYCTQDLYLGGGKINEFGFKQRSGSVHVKAALSHWLNTVMSVNQTINSMVVVGVSAGAVGAFNHILDIQQAALAAGARSLRIVLDSSMLSDDFDGDFPRLVKEHIDYVKEHPMCAPEFHNEKLTNFPCCMSIHCMLQNRQSNLNAWALQNTLITDGGSTDERLLLWDSSYDPLALSKGFLESGSGTANIFNAMNYLWHAGDTSGFRRARVLETLYHDDDTFGPRVTWAVTSAVSHMFLLGSLDLESLRCHEKSYKSNTVCSGEGVGISRTFTTDLTLTIWVTIHSWKLATVGGKRFRDVIADFINSTTNNSSSLTYGLLFDNCEGPNCVPEGGKETNPAQSLVEIENTFKPVPLAWEVVICVFLGLISSTYILRILGYRRKVHAAIPSEEEHSQLFWKAAPRIVTRGLSVKTASNTMLLKNVSINLSPGSVNGLLGRSGSGKTTLLNSLGQQVPPGMTIAIGKGGTDLSKIRCTYLRQHDLITLDNLTPVQYIDVTSRLYRASPGTLKMIYIMVRPFFPTETQTVEDDNEESKDVVFDPFNTTKIKNLSGGQRRMVAIAAALLTEPSLLLLDEPLSGLDSASSLQLMSLLKVVAVQGGCTILMTIHQPSDDILLSLTRTLILNKGRVVFNEERDYFEKKQADLGSASEQVHQVVRVSTFVSLRPRRSSIYDVLLDRHCKVENDKLDESRNSSQSKHLSSNTPVVASPFMLWQVQPLMRRLHLQYGWMIYDLVVLPICFIILTAWLQFDDGSVVQVYVATIFMCSVPVAIFRHKIFLSCKIFVAHIGELEDHRISCTSYILATLTFIYATPLVSMLLATAIGYAIMGWDFASYLAQYLFSSIHLLVGLQFGCVLCVIFRGDYHKIGKILTLYIFLSIVFSGILVNPNKIPDALVWVVYASYSFWGISGAFLSQLYYNDSWGENPCLTFFSCVLYDPNIVGRQLGYTPLSTPVRSMTVLMVWLFGLVMIQYLVVYRICNQTLKFKTSLRPQEDEESTSEDSPSLTISLDLVAVTKTRQT